MINADILLFFFCSLEYVFHQKTFCVNKSEIRFPGYIPRYINNKFPYLHRNFVVDMHDNKKKT